MKKKDNLEAMFLKLEKIVGDLETGEAPLEQAVSLYKEGMELSNSIKEKLCVLHEEIKIIANEDKIQ